MADLSIEIGGTRFKNPVMAGGATPTLTVHNMRKCIEAGVGAIEWKSVSENEISLRWQYPGNRFLDRDGLPGLLTTWETAFISLDRTLEQLREIKPLAEKEDVRLIPNLALEDVMDLRRFGGPAPLVSIERWCEFARECEAAGADVMMVNGPCPVVIGDQGPVTKSWFMDWYDSDVPPIVDALKKASSLPVWVKSNREFYPSASRFADIITKMEPDVVQTGGSVPLVHIDIETARAFVPGALPYVKGHVNWAVALISSQTPVPLTSAGNLQTARDCIERLMCGARGLFVATEIMHRGYKVITEMVSGISAFMDRKGYKRVEDMVGLAIPTIQADEERDTHGRLELVNELMERTEVPRTSVHMTVDPKKCNGCKKCLVCLFEAITMQDRIAVIDPEICERCGCCWSICPTGAVELTYV